jgi:hypothetical protein
MNLHNLLFYDIYKFEPNDEPYPNLIRKLYIFEPNDEPYPNLIRKFEFESNLIVAEPEPCDIGSV